MQARELMTYPALSLPCDTSSEDALSFAKKQGIHHIPLEGQGAISGVICTCDLRELTLRDPVKMALKREPVVVLPGATARDIAELMRSECVSSVLVKGASGWGIVTKDDLLEARLEDSMALELIDACRCMYCGAQKHLRRHEQSHLACVDCLERARHPGRFEGGEVD